MMKCLLPFLLLFSIVSVYAQNRNYNQQQNFVKANSFWTIESTNIDFNQSPPLVTANSNSKVYEGCASVADPVTGALLFYTNGSVCRDKDNNKMPNGDSLFGNGGFAPGGGSTAQGVCIVPMVDVPGKYYLFSMYGATDMNKPYKGASLFYSVVDMNLRSGLGDVVVGQKNIVLSKDTLAEGLIAVPGNNCDLWLVVHYANKPEFIAYHIDASGINTTPVVSRTGGQIRLYNDIGGMTLSPDGNKIAITSFPPFCMSGYADSISGVLVSKFDAATGVLSDAVEIKKNLQTYSVAFSPDAKMLYVTDYDELTSEQSLVQYDISSHDTAKINASRQVISLLMKSMSYMKLYRDTIYFTNMDTAAKNVISSINKPNLSGLACDYQPVAFRLLKSGTYASLPTDVVYPLLRDTLRHLVFDTLVCKVAEGIALHPSLVLKDYTYKWNTAAIDTVLTIKEEGKYWVTYDNGCHFKVDTFIVKNADLEKPVVNVDVFRLSTVLRYQTYQWLLDNTIIPGATDSTYDVRKNGNYRVVVSNGLCTDTSEVYPVTNYTGIDDLQEIAQSIRVFPNPAHHTIYVNAAIPVQLYIYSVDGRLIKTIDAAKAVDIAELSEGAYFLHIKSTTGSTIKVEKLIKMKAH